MKTELKANGKCTYCGLKLDKEGVCNNDRSCFYAGKPQYREIKNG